VCIYIHINKSVIDWCHNFVNDGVVYNTQSKLFHGFILIPNLSLFRMSTGKKCSRDWRCMESRFRRTFWNHALH